MDLKINWEHKRAKHMIERMFLRGVSREEVKMAILRGKKIKQRKTKLIESFYSFFSVVYDEFFVKKKGIWKVYPVTVKLW